MIEISARIFDVRHKSKAFPSPQTWGIGVPLLQMQNTQYVDRKEAKKKILRIQ